MYKQISEKQLMLYVWRDIPELEHCETFIGTGAIRTGKTEILSKAFRKDSMKIVRTTPYEYQTKGYNLFTIVSVSKSLALLNIIEPMINDLLRKGYKEVEKTRPFYRAKKNVFVHTTSPMGMLQIKDNDGNITRLLYVGADNKRALNRVTGLTMRGWFLDEAPLLGGTEEDNITFIERMYERTASFRVIPNNKMLQVMTTNPQTDDEGLFYTTYIKGGWNKRIAVVSLHLLDNPIFTQDDVEYYRTLYTKAQFERKIEGKWVRDNSIATYPKYHKGLLKPESEILQLDLVEFTIGLDEGQSDARAFVLTAFTRGYEEVVKFDMFYYKNEAGKPVMDIDDYKVEFWKKAQEWYTLFGKPMTLYYDSAAKYIVEPFKRYRIQQNINIPVVIKPVNKSATERTIKGKNSAIKERIEFDNNLMALGKMIINEDRCSELGRAFSKCINKDGVRIDDGKTNNVDLLDASEYGEKHRLKLIKDKLTIRGRINNVKV